MFDALEDPARARVAWQAAVDASPEPEHLRGLAEAMARAHDGDAAIIIATAAAAAWGDPAVVWTGLARTLEAAGRHQHALEAARSAIDLAGPDRLDDALAVAIEASRSLGRTAQADALALRRAKISSVTAAERDDDPTDASAALAEYRRRPTASVAARMWVASRWNPREVAIRAALLAAIPSDDPRRRVIEAELVTLAADRDPEVGRAAVAALR
jgi:tetratricopeptide (TPR) repeat protein